MKTPSATVGSLATLLTSLIGDQRVIVLGLRTNLGLDGIDVGGCTKIRVDFDFKPWWLKKICR